MVTMRCEPFAATCLRVRWLPRAQWVLRLVAVVMLMAASMGIHAAVLTASNTAGNNHRGNMFDLFVNQNVAITQFDVSPMGNMPYEIHYKEGTWVGHANDPGAWELMQSGDVAYTGGFAPVPLAEPIILSANQTHGFYITSATTAVSLNYSNGTNVGNVYSSDAVMTFYEGGGMEYPFTQGTGAVYQPRVWTGAIHYEVIGAATQFAITAPATTASIPSTTALGGAPARHRRSAAVVCEALWEAGVPREVLVLCDMAESGTAQGEVAQRLIAHPAVGRVLRRF